MLSYGKWEAPFFAKTVTVSSEGIVAVDGETVTLFGVTFTDQNWPIEFNRLINKRKIYVIPMRFGPSKSPEVRLFCGRGDLASYLIWYRRADSKSLYYFHVQAARAICTLGQYFKLLRQYLNPTI